MSKSKQGCALLDLDFIAAFDYQVMSWIYDVLRAKGVCEAVIARIKNIYADSNTIPVVNNVLGKPLRKGTSDKDALGLWAGLESP